MGAMGGKPN
jgi:hypothetical protein